MLTHVNESGFAKMVAVGEKDVTERVAEASGRIRMHAETLERIRSGGIRKGDVLAVAQVAGIMAAKRTSDLIPMCHPLFLTGADLTFSYNDTLSAIDIRAVVRCTGQTGVEMEALTAVSAAALTIYDMCKAMDRDMTIEAVRLERKAGGKSGEYVREEEPCAL